MAGEPEPRPIPRAAGAPTAAGNDPLIAYATDTADHPADRLLRRIIGWAAVLYGGVALLRTALFVALARKWLESPNTMGWNLGAGWSQVLSRANDLDMCLLVLAGLLLLLRRPASVPLLRVSVAAQVILTVAGTSHALYTEQTYASYWSKPATAAVEAMGVLAGLWLPVVLVLLTLPPLARRMLSQ